MLLVINAQFWNICQIQTWYRRISEIYVLSTCFLFFRTSINWIFSCWLTTYWLRIDLLCMYTYIYYMAELGIQSASKMTHIDWLPSRAISFSYRPASFGGKISEFIWRKTSQIQVRFTEDLSKQNTKNKVKCSQP